MKRFWLTISTAALFAIYVVFQRHVSAIPAVVAPPSLQGSSNSAVSVNVPPVSSSPPFDPQAGDSPSNSALQTAPAPKPAPQTSSPPPQSIPPRQSQPQPVPAPASKPVGQYKDGQYTGSVQDAYYGNVQVRAMISGSKITDVRFLQYPNDRSTSRYINSQAMPYLTQEAIAAQNANVDIVSGATDTSTAFVQSLASALAQAKN